jgi:hypothetical protein
MIHRTCVKAVYKDGAFLCSCGVADDSDPLLPFQYCIGGREKSNISESDRPSLDNLRNLGYNILKSLEDKTVRDIDFPELGPCSECGNLMSPQGVHLPQLWTPLSQILYRKKSFFFQIQAHVHPPVVERM